MAIENVNFNNVYSSSDVELPVLTNNETVDGDNGTKNSIAAKTPEDEFAVYTETEETQTEPVEITDEEYKAIVASIKKMFPDKNTTSTTIPVHSFAQTTSTGNSTLDALYFQEQLLLNEQQRLNTQISLKEKQKAKLSSKLNANSDMSDDSKNGLKSRISKLESEIGSLKSSLSTSKSNLSQIMSQIQQAMTTASSSTTSTAANGASAQSSNSQTYTGTGEIPADLAQRLDAKLGEGFAAKCEDIAAKLKCDVCDFLAMMYGESGIDPHCVGYNGAVGLIMFLPDILTAEGYDPSQVASMSGVDQLDLVYKFMSESKTDVAGLSEDEVLDTGTMDALCFLPAFAQQEILCSAYDSTSIYYNENSPLDLDGDGNITKTELGSRLKSKYQELYEWF